MQWKPEMFDTLVVLNLQYFKRESYISVICQAIDFAVEGRKADADTHLAGARSQNTGTGILGNIQKIKDSRFNGCLFLKSSLTVQVIHCPWAYTISYSQYVCQTSYVSIFRWLFHYCSDDLNASRD